MTSEPRRAARFYWDPWDSPGGISVQWLNSTSSLVFYWGDASPTEILPIGGTLTHRYTKPGAYTVQGRQSGGNHPVLAEAQVIIRDHKPALTFALHPDDPGVIVATAPATLDKTNIVPRYRVHWDPWGHPDARTDFWGLENAKVAYAMDPGTYTARVFDLGTKWLTEVEYTIPERTLDCTITATDRTATLTVTKAATGRDLMVSWGDKSNYEPVTGTTATHTYPSTVDDTYIVQLYYADGTGPADVVAKPVQIPGGAQ